jgi:hypothetical protein
MMLSTYQTLGRNKQRPYAWTCGNSGADVARLNGNIADSLVAMSAVSASTAWMRTSNLLVARAWWRSFYSLKMKVNVLLSINRMCTVTGRNHHAPQTRH